MKNKTSKHCSEYETDMMSVIKAEFYDTSVCPTDAVKLETELSLWIFSFIQVIVARIETELSE